jgi:preprotein translocase subunit SecE
MFKKIWIFVKECKIELKEKTNWPSKDEVLNSTIITIVSILFISISLYFIDLIANFSIQYIVVEKINFLKQFINEYSYLPFVVSFFLIILLYSRIKARWNR